MAQQRTKPTPNKKTRPPLMERHKFPAPYSVLLTIGPEDAEEIYETVTATLKAGDTSDAVRKLIAICLDESFYEYDEDDYEGGATGDPRGWTRLHALRVLSRMGEPAQAGIEPLLPLLNDEDDYVREDAPFYYLAMGQPAIEPLRRVLVDRKAETYLRAGAAESLAEIGEKLPEQRDKVVTMLEQALIAEDEDDALAAFVILSLCDIGAKESLPIIEQVFKDERADETIVGLADVQEHFGVPVTAERPKWQMEEEQKEAAPIKPVAENNSQQPYVSEVKAGRNDMCPCGSGKKYKKCCGAA